jgi:hypothetical protein
MTTEYWVNSYPPPVRCRRRWMRTVMPRPGPLGAIGIGGLLVAVLVALLVSSVSVANAEVTQMVEVDYSPGEIVTSITTTCGLLNIVSININRVPGQLQTIDHIMSKRNWHIVLVQETGVISKTSPNPHMVLCKSMQNSIFFNSPHLAHLWHKQYNTKIRDLKMELQTGAINPLQYNTQAQLAGGCHVYLSGGLAIIVHQSVLN